MGIQAFFGDEGGIVTIQCPECETEWEENTDSEDVGLICPNPHCGWGDSEFKWADYSVYVRPGDGFWTMGGLSLDGTE